MMNVKKAIGVSIILAIIVKITESIYCSYTPQTVRVVDSCPESKAELKKREREKNCSFIANIQNCTKPANFKYHCVMNEFKNKFIEVCAVEFYIIGFCAEYNMQGEVVQEDFDLKCNDVKPNCPHRYKSTEAYLYKDCYENVKKEIEGKKVFKIHFGFEILPKNKDDSEEIQKEVKTWRSNGSIRATDIAKLLLVLSATFVQVTI